MTTAGTAGGRASPPIGPVSRSYAELNALAPG